MAHTEVSVELRTSVQDRGTVANDSTLLTTVGLPKSPAIAGSST